MDVGTKAQFIFCLAWAVSPVIIYLDATRNQIGKNKAAQTGFFMKNWSSEDYAGLGLFFGLVGLGMYLFYRNKLVTLAKENPVLVPFRKRFVVTLLFCFLSLFSFSFITELISHNHRAFL